MFVSFIIPTFNRAELLQRSVLSALDWLAAEGDGEIIVIDDGSKDQTRDLLSARFKLEMALGTLRLIELQENAGVTAARNAGLLTARGRWALLLDSDDIMAPDSAAAVRAVLADHADVPVIFFRCQDMVTLQVIGEPLLGQVRLTLPEYLNTWKYAECIPALNLRILNGRRFDETLRGWEGLSYSRLMRDCGSFIVSPIVARRYRSEGEDRLSSAKGIFIRSQNMAQGHWTTLTEFWPYLGWKKRLSHFAKALFYFIAGAIYVSGSRNRSDAG